MAPISLALCSVLLWQGVIVSAHTAEAVTTADGDVYVRQRDMELQDTAHTSTASFKKGVDVGAVDKDGSVRRHGMASLLDVDNTLASELTTKELLGEIEDLKLQLVAMTSALQARAVGGDKQAQVAHIQASGSNVSACAHWSTEMMNSVMAQMIQAADNVNITVVQAQLATLQADDAFIQENPNIVFDTALENGVVDAFDKLALFAADDSSLVHLKAKFETEFPAKFAEIVDGATTWTEALTQIVTGAAGDSNAPTPLSDLWLAVNPSNDNGVTVVMQVMISAFIHEQLVAAAQAMQQAANDGSR